jgi:hypothetical protein
MGVGGRSHAQIDLPPEKRKPRNHCTEGWVSPRAGPDGCGNSRFHLDSIPGRSSMLSVDIPTELSRPKRTLTYLFYNIRSTNFVISVVKSRRFEVLHVCSRCNAVPVSATLSAICLIFIVCSPRPCTSFLKWS